MTAPNLPHVQYAVQANGDANTLLSWLGVDTASENDHSNQPGNDATNDQGGHDSQDGGYGQDNSQATPPPVDQMPHLQLALQSNGDINDLMTSLNIDLTNEQSESDAHN